MTGQELYNIRKSWLEKHHTYSMTYWKDYDYTILENVMWHCKAGKRKGTYNDVIMMFDTETSKKPLDIDALWDRHVCMGDDILADEIRHHLRYNDFKWSKDYESIASMKKMRKTGLILSKHGTDKIDVYYQQLHEAHPNIFPAEYAEYNMIENIYNYLDSPDFIDVKDIGENHVVAWTLSIRAFDHNIVTLYGHKPSELVTCIDRVCDKFHGEETYLYAHNLPYDWWFCRKFFMQKWGHPNKQLNVKPHYPIYIRFPNGVILKDSLILAQRKLEKWAKDMNVEHQKAVGCWDYDKIRNQDDDFTDDELKYIECDTLAGVECIQATLKMLNKSIYSIPYTATGIPRGDVQELAKKNHFKEKFLKMAPSFEQYKKLVELFHGGYTHANRHFIEQTISEKIHGFVKAFDFSSSYPFCLICRKYPMERFTTEDDMPIEDIVADSDENAYMFRFCATNIRLKNPKHPMPYLQYSKLQNKLNPMCDNGRVLRAEYVEIYLNEIDAKIILDQYTWDDAYCTEVEQASKDWLPRWFTDYIYKCYKDNKMYKGVDAVLYAISKAKTNSIYGMTVQRCIRDLIEEDYKTGEYTVKGLPDEEAEYNKYLKKFNSVLPYFWGVWCTSYACENLHRLGAMCDVWLYSDTDSVYGLGWHEEEVEAYNEECYQILCERDYKPFKNGKGREFVLGKAESEGDDDIYTEFRVMGAKRYCGRCKADGELHITVAGVPKKGAECLKNNIRYFKTGMSFDGLTTGKLTHTYFTVDDIYIDKYGNETGDSIDLSPCDYLLSAIELEDLTIADIEVQVYD